MTLFKGRPWHTNALVALLATWAIWSFVGVVWSLSGAPRGMLGLLDYYVFLSIPGLIAFGAYLLFVKSRYRIMPFLLLPLMYIWSAVRLYPELLSPARWQLNAAYLAQFPPVFRFGAAFFVACAIYCLFLNRQERDL